MSGSQPASDHHSALNDAWDKVVGGLDWLKSVVFGEFADHRPLSALVADMLVSFVPGVVIVTSARDAVAVTLRLACHPEKREELMEWMLLCACLITIALPIAMAVAGAAAAGVGAAVGGIAGTELGAALRAVVLMLIKEATKLVELVQFLQKFIKGDILKFLRAINFVMYEKALIQAVNKVSGQLVEMVKSVRLHLEGLRYFDSAELAIAQLAEWEKKFYAVQHDALRQVPRALRKLDDRLAEVLAQSAPKEAHTVLAGIPTEKASTTLPTKHTVVDTPGKILAKIDGDGSSITLQRASKKASSATNLSARPSDRSKRPLLPAKQKPDLNKAPESTANTKIQEVADAAVIADRERIARISSKVLDAQKKGDTDLALKLKNEAWDILRPYVPKSATDNWDEVIKRLDVSSPKDGAVFWSGDPKAAQIYAESTGGVTLGSTVGGRIIDEWDEVNKGMTWSKYGGGSGPYARDLWVGVSKNMQKGLLVMFMLSRLWKSYATLRLSGIMLRKR